jgi:hypothetical protein
MGNLTLSLGTTSPYPWPKAPKELAHQTNFIIGNAWNFVMPFGFPAVFRPYLVLCAPASLCVNELTVVACRKIAKSSNY